MYCKYFSTKIMTAGRFQPVPKILVNRINPSQKWMTNYGWLGSKQTKYSEPASYSCSFAATPSCSYRFSFSQPNPKSQTFTRLVKIRSGTQRACLAADAPNANKKIIALNTNLRAKTLHLPLKMLSLYFSSWPLFLLSNTFPFSHPFFSLHLTSVAWYVDLYLYRPSSSSSCWGPVVQVHWAPRSCSRRSPAQLRSHEKNPASCDNKSSKQHRIYRKII